jgi:predicted MPP superfamily phosphohydrolase
MLITNTLNANGDYNRDGNENICDLVKMTAVMGTTNMEEIIATYGDYFGFEMKIITEEIDALSEENVNYIFITDLHFGNGTSAQDKLILKQMESITKLANADDSIDFVVVGGDVTTGMYATKEKAIAATNAALAPLKSCTKPVLVITGNHDDNSYHVYSGDKVYIPERILSDMDWTTQVLSVNCPETIVHDKNYENSKYYYYDLPTKKTRVICLNAIDYRAPSTRTET